MSIDPSTIPDGTVVELSDGELHYADKGGYQPTRAEVGDGDPFTYGNRHVVATYTRDPGPDDLVPRDQWATLRKGDRVRIVTDYGVTVEGAVRRVNACGGGGIWLGHADQFGVSIASITTIHRLAPANPDADVLAAVDSALVGWDESRDPADVLADLRTQGWELTKAGESK